MAIRKADAEWQGSLKDGKGTMALGSGAFQGQYSFSSRFEEGTGTNPEELVGAAHAGCFSMQLSGVLGEAGHDPDRIETSAAVDFQPADAGGWEIKTITLTTTGKVPGISAEEFQQHAETAKEICPISKALAVEIKLDATLAG